MQCGYCNKEVYIAHICPYCKQYYCLEHREPSAHKCPSYLVPYKTHVEPQQQQAVKITEEPKTHLAGMARVQKESFGATFTLVVLEEVLRLVGYIKTSSFIWEQNHYVQALLVITSPWLAPYIASTILFLLTCTILFVAKRFASNSYDSDNPYVRLLRNAIPLGIYLTIAIIYILSIANWILLLLM